jgi:biotin transporter BioY
MIRELIGLCGAAAERYLRNCLLDVVTATVAALLTAVSLGFATLAAYVHLCVSEESVAAALIVCAAYGVLAIAIWAIGVMRRRATRTRRAAVLALASARDGDLLRES